MKPGSKAILSCPVALCADQPRPVPAHDWSVIGQGDADRSEHQPGGLCHGPALYGNGGGVLGWRNDSTDHIVLAWNDAGKVGIGTNNPATGVDGLVNIGNSAAAEGTVQIYLNTLTSSIFNALLASLTTPAPIIKQFRNP